MPFEEVSFDDRCPRDGSLGMLLVFRMDIVKEEVGLLTNTVIASVGVKCLK